MFAQSRALANISRTAPQRVEVVQKAFYELCETWEPRIQLIAFNKEAADLLWPLMQRAYDENRLVTFESGIELATADARKVVRLLTYDEDLLTLDEITAAHFPIAKPTRDQDLLGLTFSASTESRMPADAEEASEVRLDADTNTHASAADKDPLATLVAQMRGKRGKPPKRGTK